MKIETLIELLGAMAKARPECPVATDFDGYQLVVTGVEFQEEGGVLWVVIR